MAKKKKIGKTVETLSGKDKNSSVVTARMAIMVLLDIIAILALSALQRDGRRELQFYEHWLTPLTVVFGVLTLAAVAYQIVVIAKKINTSAHVITPAMIICVALFGLLSCLLYTRLIPMTIIIASVVSTVLFVVYCLYMHVFYR